MMMDYIATYWALGLLIMLLFIFIQENKKEAADEEKKEEILFLPHEEIIKPLEERRFTFDDYKDAPIEELLEDFKPFDLYILGMITEKELDQYEQDFYRWRN